MIENLSNQIKLTRLNSIKLDMKSNDEKYK